MNQRGSSITELVMSQVGMAILILAVGSLFTLTVSLISDAKHTSDVNQAMLEIRRSLSRPGECTRNLLGHDLNVGSHGAVTVTSLTSKVISTGAEETLAEESETRLGVATSAIRLRALDKVGLVTVAAKLELEFPKPGPAGRSALVREIPILARVQQGKVRECWVRKENSLAAADEMCKVTTGGALDMFNPTTGECDLANGEWFEGTSNSAATCPQGTVLPDKASEGYNCEAAEPAGFVDPSPGLKVKLTDGNETVARRDAYFYYLDRSTKSCQCAYATDLPPAQIAALKCRIRCVVL